MTILLGFLGLVIGSFIAAMVTRWPDVRSVLVGRSRCDACRAPLSAAELVPVVSALALRGRCRACKAPISALHWQIELAALAVGVMASFAQSPAHSALGAIFGWLLLALAFLDLTVLLLPNILTLCLALIGLLAGLLGSGPGVDERLIGGFVGFGSLWLVKSAYRRLRGRDGLGGGDPKLLGAIGCWLGWQPLPLVLLGASVAGLAYVLSERARGRHLAANHRLPFGAMLALSAYSAWFATNAWSGSS